MTYLELKNAVAENVIDLPTRVTNAVPGFVNRAIRRLQQLHDFQVQQTSTTRTTTVNTTSLGARPTDWRKPLGEAFAVGDVAAGAFAQRIPLQWANNDAFTFLGMTADTVGPPTLLREGPETDTGAAGLFVAPSPDGNAQSANGEYTIYIPYLRYLPALSADGDTNWFTENAEDYIINKATSYAFMKNWDEERAALWAQWAKNEVSEVVFADKLRAIAGINELVPFHQGVYSPRVRI